MSFQRSLVKYEEVRFKGITGSKAFSTIVYKSGTVGTGYWYHMVKISYVWNRVKIFLIPVARLIYLKTGQTRPS